MPVKPTFFKFRHRFNFSPHRYEIGRAIFQNKAVEENFFLLKIYKIEETEYPDFYSFHLNHALKKYPDEEQQFFNYVRDIVINRIKHFKRQNPFSSNYAANMVYARKLESFKSFLSTVDKWNANQPIESVLNEKDKIIDQLSKRVEELEAALKEYSKYEAGEKIVINKGCLPVFIDLVHQLQELVLPNGNKLLRSQAQSPWYKMISKYFIHGENEIPINTARNYFSAQKEDQPPKFITITEKDKLFKIISRH